MQHPLIIALDFKNLQEVQAFLSPFKGRELFVKVGMELFYKEGPEIIKYLKNEGYQIFLDLKLHDIPNTVKMGMRSLASLGVDLVNVHAAGGRVMMEAALEGLEAGSISGKRPRLIAVTQLTSTSDVMLKSELLIQQSLQETVKSYAVLAQKSGLDGVVCSVLEVPMLREVCGDNFLTVTPGIRLADDAKNDQTRIATPAEARNAGSSMIVVGRSVTSAENPVQKYEEMKKQWDGATV
ncbi:orotidine-5'-phosphate decarboxylase [Bacillus mesophilus]|uniref:Orotidine 5'-phosphate decarboxylase n=1 Tax=Bacillus mesophilus TaxID=1808955 RepID=A0A6M0Q587_9BACI|nr:orotidine-5'-phosphate decarboxylase [Bacillus mesophilus]MBM7659425.1 orotidine-5'-phosphate decarboxylase [Bacillus mesophilus]NEY70298.1 orotidine-5'-phosphate decarboxylase [Bacillus mesophilus]